MGYLTAGRHPFPSLQPLEHRPVQLLEHGPGVHPLLPPTGHPGHAFPPAQHSPHPLHNTRSHPPFTAIHAHISGILSRHNTTAALCALPPDLALPVTAAADLPELPALPAPPPDHLLQPQQRCGPRPETPHRPQSRQRQVCPHRQRPRHHGGQPTAQPHQATPRATGTPPTREEGEGGAGRGAGVRARGDCQRAPDPGERALRVLGLQDEVQAARQCAQTHHHRAPQREAACLCQV